MQQSSCPDFHHVLAVLMPMHVVLDQRGCVTSAGPTISKIAGDLQTGSAFFDHFTVTKPVGVQNPADLASTNGIGLKIRAVAEHNLVLNAQAVAYGSQVVVNLAFGLTLSEAVQRHGLSVADFAPTDQTVGMLYLTEAKSLALGEYKQLSRRLFGAKSKAEREANTDSLTGLSNLRALQEELGRLQINGEEFALMALDLDHFKTVNDSLGHAAGDHVLQVAAKILKDETREGDVVSRNGGDEFTLLLKGIRDKKSLQDIADRVIKRLEKPIPFEGAICHISASIGSVVSSPGGFEDVTQLTKSADKALYQSKREGRGRFTIVS